MISLTKIMFSRRFFLINLVLVGVILGFVMSSILFACSTAVQPRDSARAEEPATAPLQEVDPREGSFRGIAEAVLPSVVQLTVQEVRSVTGPQGDRPWFDFFFRSPDNGEREFRTQGLGSGVIVRRDGSTYYVLTNDHVVSDGDQITVLLYDSREFEGEVVGTDSRKDLAMVAFEADDEIPIAALGDSDSLYVGDWVLAVGSPFGFQSTVTAGIVSALGRRGGPAGNISDFIQTDAAINQGNSGGALVNLRGEVVGINTWITSQTGGSVGLGFSIPINNARRAIDDFIETGAVRYGWLGVSIRSVAPEIADDLGLEHRSGAIVHHVFRGSPAEEGGVLPGDFITEINGRAVNSSDELIALVADLEIDEEAVFRLVRQGEARDVTVVIAARSDEREIADQNRNLWPGLSVFPVDAEMRDEMGTEGVDRGVVISNVEARTPAAQAGFRVGDIVTEINNRTIDSVRDFYRELNELQHEVLSMQVVRGENELEIDLHR